MPKVNLFHSSKERTIVVSGRVPVSLAELLDAKVKEIGTTQNRVVGALIETFVDPESDQLGLRSGIAPVTNNDEVFELQSELDAISEIVDDLTSELEKAKKYINYITTKMEEANNSLKNNWAKTIKYDKYQ